MIEVVLPASFRKEYQKMPKEIQVLFLEKLQFFVNDPKHPSLRIHKLHGVLAPFLSLSINREYRALFLRKGNSAQFFSIAHHKDIYTS